MVLLGESWWSTRRAPEYWRYGKELDEPARILAGSWNVGARGTWLDVEVGSGGGKDVEEDMSDCISQPPTPH